MWFENDDSLLPPPSRRHDRRPEKTDCKGNAGSVTDDDGCTKPIVQPPSDDGGLPVVSGSEVLDVEFGFQLLFVVEQVAATAECEEAKEDENW